jgi:hypothetical protein
VAERFAGLDRVVVSFRVAIVCLRAAWSFLHMGLWIPELGEVVI